jgi:hypothetical protein
MGVKMMIDGIKVIYKPSTKDIVSVTYLKGGTEEYSKEQEELALTMSVLSNPNAKISA